MALPFCSCPLAVDPACAVGSDQHAMGATAIGVELEDGGERLMPRLGARGLAHMHSATIAALHGGGDAALRGQRLTQRVPAVVDAVGLELQSQRVHEVIRQHADEQVPFHASINAVEHRALTQVGLEGAEHRLQLGEHDGGAPQRGVVLISQGRAQAVHARIGSPKVSRAAGLDAFDPGNGGDALALGVGGNGDLKVLRGAREALLGAAQALQDGGHVLGAARLAQAGCAI